MHRIHRAERERQVVDRRRRRFLTEGPAASLLTWAALGRAEASHVTPGTTAGETIVREFLTSWSRGLTTVLSYLHPECLCRLTQWGPDRRGHAQIADALATYVGRPREVVTRISRISSADAVVFAHYENRYAYETGVLSWEGVGVFLLSDDKIKEWRGYTIRVS